MNAWIWSSSSLLLAPDPGRYDKPDGRSRLYGPSDAPSARLGRARQTHSRRPDEPSASSRREEPPPPQHEAGALGCRRHSGRLKASRSRNPSLSSLKQPSAKHSIPRGCPGGTGAACPLGRRLRRGRGKQGPVSDPGYNPFGKEWGWAFWPGGRRVSAPSPPNLFPGEAMHVSDLLLLDMTQRDPTVIPD